MGSPLIYSNKIPGLFPWSWLFFFQWYFWRLVRTVVNSYHVSGTASQQTYATRTSPTRVSGVNLKRTRFLAAGAQCDILLNCAIQIPLLNWTELSEPSNFCTQSRRNEKAMTSGQIGPQKPLTVSQWNIYGLLEWNFYQDHNTQWPFSTKTSELAGFFLDSRSAIVRNLTQAFFWDRQKFFISSVTQSYEVFFGRPLSLSKDTSYMHTCDHMFYKYPLIAYFSAHDCIFKIAYAEIMTHK